MWTRCCAAFLSLVIVAGGLSAEDVLIGNRLLRVAEGYEVSLAAESSLAERPIAVSRDERGRLYVTDSGGMSERAEKQLSEKPHRIRRLEDTDGDGVYDRSTLFADRLMFPEGCLWYEGSLYVAAPPEIWKLTDDNDDGVADRREVWFDGRTLTGCGNDLHGPYLGLDGRLYWCKGAFAEQRHQLSDGQELVTQSSHIFRAKPDGTHVENVLTGGMDNPVNVAFLNNGERFLSCTFFQHPEAGRRDGLIHAIYGGVYGKKHESIYAHPMTGDVMPVLTHQGAAAPCGLIAGSERLFGGGHDQQLFACYFNLHKVVQHRLVPDGPTYRTEDVDLLSCDHPDFHPTDVFEDADGSLLVVDTGGWYKVCCPTSQLAKPDVPGAVYRIRRRGLKSPADPLGLSLNWETATPSELAGYLGDDRLFVQRRAMMALRRSGESSIAALRALLGAGNSNQARRNAIWTLAGIDSVDSAAAAAFGLTDADAGIRQAAAHVTGLLRYRGALPQLLRMAEGDEAGPARAAAEAIGRLKQGSAVSDVQNIVADLPVGPVDVTGAPEAAGRRIQEHALIYSLIEIADPQKTREGLSSSVPSVIRASLVALDQMRASDLGPGDVLPHMEHPSAAVRNTAAWVVEQHPNWAGELTAWFGQRLARVTELSDSQQTLLAGLLSELAEASEIQMLLLQTLKAEQSAARRIALTAMADSRLTAIPTAWLDGLAARLQVAAEEERDLLIRVIQGLPMPKDGHVELRAQLLRLGSDETVSDELRMIALDAAGAGIALEDPAFSLLRKILVSEQSLEFRSLAATTLASATLTEVQMQRLIDVVPAVGPMELPKILPAFEAFPSEATGQRLLMVLQESKGMAGLRADLVQTLLGKYPEAVQESGKSLLKLLNAGLEEQTAVLEKTLASLPEGDVRRGHEVFMSRRAACNTCHKLGYGGGMLGPDLTSIGRVRNRRDLLEAILFPGASLVRGYEPVSVELEDGRVVSGIIRGENASEVVVAVDAQKTLNLARSSIVQILPSSVSPMPNGIATLLSSQELADLLAFLQTDQR